MCSRVWLMNTKRLCILSLNFIDALQSKSNPSKTYVYICIYIWKNIYNDKRKNKIWLFFNFCHYELLCYTAKSTIILYIIMICKKSYFHLSLRMFIVYMYFVCPGPSVEILFFRWHIDMSMCDYFPFLSAFRMDDAEACFILSSRCEVDRTSSVSF